MARLAFWQPVLSLISNSRIAMFITGQIKWFAYLQNFQHCTSKGLHRRIAQGHKTAKASLNSGDGSG